MVETRRRKRKAGKVIATVEREEKVSKNKVKVEARKANKKLKTEVLGEEDVSDYLEAIESDKRRHDVERILGWMEECTGKQPKLWGNTKKITSAMVGFGVYKYTNSTKVENSWFRMGLASRKAAITLYLYGCNLEGNEKGLLKSLGKFKNGKGCLYIKKLSDVDTDVLTELIRSSWEWSLNNQ